MSAINKVSSTTDFFNTATQLVNGFSEVIHFPPLPKPDEAGRSQVASRSGFAALEVEPQRLCVFVQTKDMGAIQIVQHVAILLQLIKYFLPIWTGAMKWLNNFFADERRAEAVLPAGDKRLKFRKTSAGVFVEVEER